MASCPLGVVVPAGRLFGAQGQKQTNKQQHQNVTVWSCGCTRTKMDPIRVSLKWSSIIWSALSGLLRCSSYASFSCNDVKLEMGRIRITGQYVHCSAPPGWYPVMSLLQCHCFIMQMSSFQTSLSQTGEQRALQPHFCVFAVCNAPSSSFQ